MAEYVKLQTISQLITAMLQRTMQLQRYTEWNGELAEEEEETFQGSIPHIDSPQSND